MAWINFVNIIHTSTGNPVTFLPWISLPCWFDSIWTNKLTSSSSILQTRIYQTSLGWWRGTNGTNSGRISICKKLERWPEDSQGQGKHESFYKIQLSANAVLAFSIVMLKMEEYWNIQPTTKKQTTPAANTAPTTSHNASISTKFDRLRLSLVMGDRDGRRNCTTTWRTCQWM
jgi:hypothetical protein